MPQNSRRHRLKVCLLSPHPLVRAEFERVLSSKAFQISFKALSAASSSDIKEFQIPRAAIYVIDAQAPAAIVHSLIEHLLELYPSARVVVLASKHTDAETFELLRMGVKGLLTYGQPERQWQDALPLVASGGYWVPRSVLSRFVESIVANRKIGAARSKTPGTLSRREKEVLDPLLQNLSNKEIASQLNISERTVKFHVSNLLAKHGVRRRADLIVMRFQEGELSV
ncbi:MAG TPA: response regulator transcription factor [Candidatus Acidoferrales bacterium]|nr:response regulator transcription factor [Candidatus Acidoferrales bacterium]